MTINGEGNLGEKTDRGKSVGGTGNALNSYYPTFVYVDDSGIVHQRKVKRRMKYPKGELRPRAQFLPQPKNSVKRNQVSLTHFPRGRRNEEVSLIRQQYFRNGRSPTHHSRNARYAKRQHMTIHSPGYYKNRRSWLIRSRYCGSPADGFRLPYEPSRKYIPEDLAPGTYVVQIEPETGGECEESDGTYAIERRHIPHAKFYYLFERLPFKVKFLNYVPTSFEDYPPSRTMMTPSPSDASYDLMPPFRCKPPECREVLYCKYFQCMSLGFFPDPRNCRKYFFCDLNCNGFVLYHMLCPKGRIFDPEMRECRLKEIMDKRDVHKCQSEAAKSRKSEGMRIKKNDGDGLIKYKSLPCRMWKRRRLYRIPGNRLEARRNATIQRRAEGTADQPDAWFQRNSDFPQGWPTNSPPFSNVTRHLCTIPKYCDTLLNNTTSALTGTTASNSTKGSKERSTTTSTPSTTTERTTLSSYSPPPKKTKAPKKQFFLGDLYSDAYQEDMQDYNYDGYYDNYDISPDKADDYEWLRQGLTEYLDKLKLKKKNNLETETTKTESLTGRTTPAVLNDSLEVPNEVEKELPKLQSEQTLAPILMETDRAIKMDPKTSSTPILPEQTETPAAVSNLPDFEKTYKEQQTVNLDGYPCKEYARYPDKFDRGCYYECGVQPDGNMRIEHKCCPKGEEFSSQYLECVATEYLKMTHKRSAFRPGRPNKRPLPEPEDNYDDEKEANEWLDATRSNKVPNEFKSRTKNTLRIFHLHCRRNSSEGACENQQEGDDDGSSCDHNTNIRSFTASDNAKAEEETQKIDDEEGDEYEDDEEEEYDDEGEKSSVDVRSTSEKSLQESSSTAKESATSKILLDADIHVGRDFENALRNILGGADELEKDQNRDSKDSIFIRLSGDKPGGRTKRNFLKSFFSKSKSKNSGDEADKEGIVSMMTLINGLPSDYERDVLMQKLERRKMMNSHFSRVQQGKRKRKSEDSVNGKKTVLLGGEG